MVLPALKRYRGYALPLNMLLTYLWLTSLIFSSQDYSGGRCRFFSPPGIGRCGMKHTIQAFFIIGLCVTSFPFSPSACRSMLTLCHSSFLLFNTILEALMWATHKRNQNVGGGHDAEKSRPLTSSTGATATGPADGDRMAQAPV
jgi:hypothetical protein